MSCGQIKSDKKFLPKKYIDIKGLIDQQIKILDSISPILLKDAAIDGTKEHLKIDTGIDFSWKKELSIFKSADINKPVLEDSYEIFNEIDSGKKRVIYHSKTPSKTQVDSMAIIINETDNIPIKIIAFLSSENALFESAKTLNLTFKKNNNQSQLSSYSIEGWQKMIARDTSTFIIEGTLNFQ